MAQRVGEGLRRLARQARWMVPCLALCAGRATSAHPVEVAFDEAGYVGPITTTSEAGRARPGALILVDADAHFHGRAIRYVQHLEAADFIVLTAEIADELVAHETIRRSLEALAARADIDPARVALIAFGAHAPVALGAAGANALVLVYPGCATLADVPAPPRPVLLLHGTDDPANLVEDCADLADAWRAANVEVRLRVYRHATFGSDIPGGGDWGLTLRPAPGGRGRVEARYWPALAEMSAAQVADFLATRLLR